MRVLFATADLEGPQGHYRAHVPAAALRRAGHSAAVVGTVAADDRGRLRAFDRNRVPWVADVVVLQGWFHADAPRVIDQAQRAGQRVAVDVDDDVWTIPDDNPAAEAASAWRPILESMLGAASAAFVSTPTLVERVTAAGARTAHVCPNGIETAIVRAPLEGASVSDRDERAPSHAGRTVAPPVIGWLGRTSYRGNDLAVLAGQLRPYLERGRARFQHFGHVDGDPPVTDILGTAAGVMEPKPWCYIEQLWTELRADVVVIPQVPCDFAYARSAATGLLAGALGIPTMATITPAYRALADAGALAWPVWENGGGWAAGFDFLLSSDPIGWARRRRLGHDARGAVVKRWDSNIVGRAWRDALRDVHLSAVAGGRRR